MINAIKKINQVIRWSVEEKAGSMASASLDEAVKTDKI